MKIELTQDEYEQLLIVLGMATAVIMDSGNKAGFYRTLALVNRIGANSPNFTPYEIPAEFQ